MCLVADKTPNFYVTDWSTEELGLFLCLGKGGLLCINQDVRKQGFGGDFY